MTRGRQAIALLFAAAAVAVAACTSFEDPSTVIDLRVLGIMAEPSEIILDADLTDPAMPILDPANNPAVTITPLIIDPAGRPISYTAVACPNNAFGAAPPGPGGMGSGGPYPSGGARTSVGSAMCDEQSPTTWPITAAPIDPAAGTASFTFQPSVDNLIAAFRADVFVDQFRHVHGGFDLGMPLTIQLNIDAGGERLVAIKRILYWAVRINDAQMPNQRPTIAELRLYGERDPVTGELLNGPLVLPDSAPFQTVSAGTQPWIEPAFEPALAEPYVTTVLDTTTHLAVPRSVPRETLRYAYYATAGTFGPFRTASEVTPGFVGTVHLESRYTAPAVIEDVPFAPGTTQRLVTIWVVVRDDRGGESWITRQLEIIP